MRVKINGVWFDSVSDDIEFDLPQAMSPLAGTPRDLQSIEEHIDRLQVTVLKLWSYRNMKLLHCRAGHQANVRYEDATDELRNIRYDVGAVLSAIKAIQKEQNNGQ